MMAKTRAELDNINECLQILQDRINDVYSVLSEEQQKELVKKRDVRERRKLYTIPLNFP